MLVGRSLFCRSYRAGRSQLVALSSDMVIKVALMTLVIFVTSCDDLLDIPPPETEIVRETVFESDDTALAALSGVYNKLVTSSSFNGGSMSVTVTEGVYGDELISYASAGSQITPYFLSNIVSTNAAVENMWSDCYNMIYSANAAIEGLNSSESVSPDVRKQLMGEALFLRAFLHFYLVNTFGAVPYIRTTSYETNSKVVRTPVDEVYDKMIEDLVQAKDYLSDNYPTANRVRVNKGAATALLARAYLYNRDWENAEAQATEIISDPQYELLDELSAVFLKESKETIWQLIPPYGSTNEGAVFILLAPPTYVALRNEVVNSFELNDLRKENWTDSILSSSGLTKWFFPFKYKIKNVDNDEEYSVVMRIAEQYLIRAEARLKQDMLTGPESAESDINSVRSRAGLPVTTADTEDELLAAIMQERRVELFTEWGHRFFDLKRWDKADEVIEPMKPGWESTDVLLPIPLSELLANPNLKQNPGY